MLGPGGDGVLAASIGRRENPALVGQDLDPHLRRALLLEAEQLRRATGDVDDPPVGERAAVVDPKLQRPAVLQVGHEHHARQGQGPVRRGQAVHVVLLAIGGREPVEIRAVPGGDARLVVVVVDRRVVPDAGDLVGPADLVLPGRGLPGNGLAAVDDELGLGAPGQSQPENGRTDPAAPQAASPHVVVHFP